ncbi:uncharacterized protein VP01_3234g1 [Puccinia sorghi]|uniref:Uncharacterized protein n=1 Tax=Puccinia sorghi TaxID=27349 RepID=A0A0L6V016_9BASI|nr:uncharacterized protein VP01_3234g1 [Puccinia sorghi]
MFTCSLRNPSPFHFSCNTIMKLQISIRLKWDNPYNLWFGTNFNLKRLKPSGCLCYVNIPHHLQEGKFRDTSKKAIMTEFPGVSIFSSTDPSHNYDPLSPADFQEIDIEASSPNDSPTHKELQVLVYHEEDNKLNIEDSLAQAEFLSAPGSKQEETEAHDNNSTPSQSDLSLITSCSKPGWDIARSSGACSTSI